MTGRNQKIIPYVRNYRWSTLRSNNSIELSMIVCAIASTIPKVVDTTVRTSDVGYLTRNN
ncbi:hypothetical protein Ahy_A03g015628 [Arachis hypogaea]|uniref:Uncharacterized protein n=1 Tax=Arachis hypogaea TaxID=3818 RepID=A0A445E0U5_ARAHY|nr:hypothetical protein Ahy_A03g015628 [Arachis hypogaea]